MTIQYGHKFVFKAGPFRDQTLSLLFGRIRNRQFGKGIGFKPGNDLDFTKQSDRRFAKRYMMNRLKQMYSVGRWWEKMREAFGLWR